MATIVSAFISNVNSRTDRTIESYYQYGKLVLQSTTPKIIFLDEKMYNLAIKDYNNKNTLLIQYNKLDSYLYNYIDKLNNFKLNTDNNAKDTIEYMFTMCNKTEWIKKAIDIDIFNSTNFIWIDFGIKHVCSCSDEEFIEKINKLNLKIYDKIRIGNIWNLSVQYNYDILKQITWYFAGGVFGGDKKSLLYFADLMKEQCIDIMSIHNTITWEVNIWYILYTKYPELFEPYKCNHCNTIIDNY